jgi:hypothetical protein
MYSDLRPIELEVLTNYCHLPKFVTLLLAIFELCRGFFYPFYG